MSWHKLELTYEEFKKNKKSLSNTQIDKYVIYEKIGSGSYGSVYKGINDENKKEVAIKVLDLYAIEQSECAEKVKNIRKRLAKTESELMMKIDSEHVMKLFDVYENRHLKVMVVEYCDGGTIAEQIMEARMMTKTIPEKEAIEIVKQIILGLSDMHKCNIIHRDLKTENIMSSNRIYKIVDLGFARMIPADSSDDFGTIAGTVLGTIITMAPEVMKRERYGLKADIWSIGVILYEMIYGKLPYEAKNNNEMLELIMSKNIFPNDGKIDGIRPSQEVLSLMKKMLQIDQKKRIGWRELIEEKIFAVEHQIEETYRFTADMSKVKMGYVNEPEERADDEILERLLFEESLFEEDTKPVLVFNLNEREIEEKKQNVDLTEKNTYQWAVTNHLECLKTELILRQIVMPIEKNALLSLKSRKVVELMYLLSSRCFFNMSFILNEFIDSNNPIVKDLNKKAERLYFEVKNKLEAYSEALTKQENKIGAIVNDRVSKIFNGEEFENKDRFLTGIENSEFTKWEQIQYTNDKYIKEFVDQEKIKDKLVRAKLKNYVIINGLVVDDLKEIKFFDKVKQIIENDEKHFD